LSSVTTLLFDNGLCFEKIKVRRFLLLNSRHFEVWRHIFSYTPMRRVQRYQIKLFELHFHIPVAVLFYCFQIENYRPRKPRQ
jgi:hypothetical protein